MRKFNLKSFLMAYFAVHLHLMATVWFPVNIYVVYASVAAWRSEKPKKRKPHPDQLCTC